MSALLEVVSVAFIVVSARTQTFRPLRDLHASVMQVGLDLLGVPVFNLATSTSVLIAVSKLRTCGTPTLSRDQHRAGRPLDTHITTFQ